MANLTAPSKTDRDDDGGSFQVVSYHRVSNAACAHVHTSPVKVSQDDSMKLVDASMMKTFQAFHKEILPRLSPILRTREMRLFNVGIKLKRKTQNHERYYFSNHIETSNYPMYESTRILFSNYQILAVTLPLWRIIMVTQDFGINCK